MSRTSKGSKGSGHEYWGKRSELSGMRDPGKVTKRATHRAERRQGKKQTKDQE